ncbi:MAG: hypothetical protein Ta2G_13260 [Termitinemataceae bacterium]|nr:MAG: hypothetical protein Ta2G_13260 [Termitinemataceae bacterium]
MKYNSVFSCILVLSFAAFLLSCEATDPKSLAQQSYDITVQAAISLSDSSKIEKLNKKSAKLEKKIAALSEADKAVYNEEFQRLLSEGLSSIFDDSQSTSETN